MCIVWWIISKWTFLSHYHQNKYLEYFQTRSFSQFFKKKLSLVTLLSRMCFIGDHVGDQTMPPQKYDSRKPEYASLA